MLKIFFAAFFALALCDRFFTAYQGEFLGKVGHLALNFESLSSDAHFSPAPPRNLYPGSRANFGVEAVAQYELHLGYNLTSHPLCGAGCPIHIVSNMYHRENGSLAFSIDNLEGLYGAVLLTSPSFGFGIMDDEFNTGINKYTGFKKPPTPRFNIGLDPKNSAKIIVELGIHNLAKKEMKLLSHQVLNVDDVEFPETIKVGDHENISLQGCGTGFAFVAVYSFGDDATIEFWGNYDRMFSAGTFHSAGDGANKRVGLFLSKGIRDGTFVVDAEFIAGEL
ncbi:hypothetical protein RCL1_004350 [Eukaryota sp. TZLM3-RCL]